MTYAFTPIKQAIHTLQQGGVIAYPTEGVYGLGCDPFNETAVRRLCQLKQRDVAKGLILISHNWSTVEPWIQPLAADTFKKIQATWPEPNTWVIPAQTHAPAWIRGEHHSVAIRITAHPLAKALCKAYGKPIVSTSANPAGLPPAKTAAEVKQYFGAEVDIILEGAVGELQGPTPMWDAVTGKQLR